MTDDIALNVPTADDWESFWGALTTAFGETHDDDVAAVERQIFEPARCLIAQREGEIVGTAGIATRQLSVPGGLIPAGHVTFVSVAATARRQGVLTRFMTRQFDDMVAAGESVAVLWASEGRIYQRFGYGLAARRLNLQISSRELEFVAAHTAGRLREGKPDDLRDTVAKIYDQVYDEHVGWSERTARHWDYLLADPAIWRRGATPQRVLIHYTDLGPDGYALYRIADNWNDNGPNGEVRINEVVATTPQAYASTWRFLLSIDLTRSVTHRMAAIDEPLQFMVNEPRLLGARIADAIWLRILDLPIALAARRYATDVDVVLEVSDDRRPANSGRWRLTGSPTSASCLPTTDPADLRCDIRALGAAYLGGSSLYAQADGGLVTELRPAALAAASTAFGWHRSPSTVEMF